MPRMALPALLMMLGLVPGIVAPLAAEPIDFRQLKEKLPETLSDLPRGEATGQKLTAGPYKMSQAQAEYVADGVDAMYDLQYIDYANTQMMAGAASWMDMEFDQETDKGFTRTGERGGFPCFEQFESDAADGTGTGTVHVVVGQRIMVLLSGVRVTPEQLMATADQLPLTGLAELVPASESP